MKQGSEYWKAQVGARFTRTRLESRAACYHWETPVQSTRKWPSSHLPLIVHLACGQTRVMAMLPAVTRKKDDMNSDTFTLPDDKFSIHNP